MTRHGGVLVTVWENTRESFVPSVYWGWVKILSCVVTFWVGGQDTVVVHRPMTKGLEMSVLVIITRDNLLVPGVNFCSSPVMLICEWVHPWDLSSRGTHLVMEVLMVRHSGWVVDGIS